MNPDKLVIKQRDFFKSHQTLPYEFRRMQLQKLRSAIYKYQNQLEDALQEDLGKNNHESYMTEIGFVLKELTYNEKHLKKMMKPRRVKSPLTDFPSSSYRYADPYGVVLIISPWNYPVNLTLGPLIGAIAAGNTAIIKPSEFSSKTSQVLDDMISETFEEQYIKVIQGGIKTNQDLLRQKFNYIFFTGSTNVGKIVMEKASKYLTPISLELGGKSPVVVDKTANISVAAKRIAFGKYLNSGQTCIAPDYLYIHTDVKDQFIKEIQEVILEFFGESPLHSENYGSIINEKHFQRLTSYLDDGECVVGGDVDEQSLRISPTVLDAVELNSIVMNEEIFGPILPVIEYHNIEEVVDFIGSRPAPLALYLFTEDKQVESQIISECQFGGGCVNDTVVHIASEFLPFGGVGESGMGSYHGEKTFQTFTHYKSILKKRTWFDLPIRYAPYTSKKTNLVRKFLK